MITLVVFTGALFFSLQGKPRLEITPENALLDMPIKISVSNLKPHEQVTIKTSQQFEDNSVWESSAVFKADNQGSIDVAGQAPISGSYHGVDGMGLFWSMLPAESASVPSVRPDEIAISVFSQDKLLTQKKITRTSISSDVEQKDISRDGVVGTFFYPKNMKSGPAIITLTGSSGGISKTISQLLASHGYAVLALGYFGMPGLPDKLEEIPLEYFQNAIHWLKKQPQVDPNCVALWGVSYGGELVMLLGSTFPTEINAIVAYVPSNLVYGGIPNFNKPAWTFKNQPLSFMPMPTTEELLSAVKEGKVPFHMGTVEDPQEPTLLYLYGLNKFSEFIDKSAIPVENIRSPLLLLTGEDDKLWPSTLYANRIIQRLDQKRSLIERKHIHFQGAGHYFELPYAPACTTHPYFHPVVKLWCTMGGIPQDNAHASIAAWNEALRFLKQHLGCNR